MSDLDKIEAAVEEAERPTDSKFLREVRAEKLKDLMTPTVVAELVRRLREAEKEAVKLSRAAWLARQLIFSLPKKRDWLDPSVEAEFASLAATAPRKDELLAIKEAQS